MPGYSYGTLWEAFAGGEYEGGGAGLRESYTAEDYEQQTEKFYQNVFAPAMGYESFNNPEYFSGFNPTGFEQAEHEFRMAIGDPYLRSQDPFKWEKMSRYNPQDAQSLLEGELYDRVKDIGGTTGDIYSTSMDKARADYKTSLKAPREELTYASLTSDISKQSGTSGLALKSGSGIKASEDILTQAYKDIKTTGTGYVQSMDETLTTFQSDLDTALTTYLSALDTEKSTWYDTLLADMDFAEGSGGLGTKLTEEWLGSAGHFTEDWQEGLIYNPEEEDYGYFRGDYGHNPAMDHGSACPSGQLWAGGAGCVDYEEWQEIGGWAPYQEEEPWVPWTEQEGYDPEDAEWSSENTGAYEEFLTECDLGCGWGKICVNDQCVPDPNPGRGGATPRKDRKYGGGHGKTGGANPGVR